MLNRCPISTLSDADIFCFGGGTRFEFRSSDRSKHFGQGTRRVTRNRPSDVCTKRVPNVGYQSSSSRSM